MPYPHTPSSAGLDEDEPAWQWLARDLASTPEQQARVWLAPRLDCTPDTVPLQRTPRGRPRLLAAHVQALHTRHDISWSHSGHGLLVAHARDAVVGVDLEYERSRRHVLALAHRYFHPDEVAWLSTQTDETAQQSAFIRFWCAKEAVLKAHGHGLAFGLDRLRFLERDGSLHLHACDAALGIAAQWRLRELQPMPG
ncbi:MAG: 4'-phosphopantetheinyl transferase superfamily protein, partial [Thermomonas sp.]